MDLVVIILAWRELDWNWLFSFELLRNFRFNFATAYYCNFRVSFGTAGYCGLQVNSGLQPPTRWEPFVAGTMLRRPEPTNEKVESTILSTIAIDITHLSRFALLLLLRILRYVWRNHVATWAQANNSGRNLDSNKIRFLHLHYILQYRFGLDLNLKNTICKYYIKPR